MPKRSLPLIIAGMLVVAIVLAWLVVAYVGVGSVGIRLGSKVLYMPEMPETAKVADSLDWQPIGRFGSAVGYLPLVRKVSLGDYARMYLVRLDARDVGFQVLYSPKYASCEEFAKTNSLDVCINGSFFSNAPLGLVVSGGHKVTPPHKFMQGYFVVDSSGRPDVLIGELGDRQNIKEALQSFPALIKDGHILVSSDSKRHKSWYNAASRAARSAIAKGKNGDIYLVVIKRRGVSFGELAWLLYVLGMESAFCLDGGGSAQLYVNAGKIRINLEGDPVPVVLGVRLTEPAKEQ